jgi:hypothetical protein
MMGDYSSALMASDCSRSVVMSCIKEVLSDNMDKEIQCWRLEEMTRRKNALHPWL